MVTPSIKKDTKNEVNDAIIWIDDNMDPVILEEIRKLAYRYVYGIINFGSYMVRRLGKAGIVCGYSTGIDPVKNGYVINIVIEFKGVKKKTYDKIVALLKRAQAYSQRYSVSVDKPVPKYVDLFESEPVIKPSLLEREDEDEE